MRYESLPQYIYVIGNQNGTSISSSLEEDLEGNIWFGVWSSEKECKNFKEAHNYKYNVTKISRLFLSQFIKAVNIEKKINISYLIYNRSAEKLLTEKVDINKNAEDIIILKVDDYYLHEVEKDTHDRVDLLTSNIDNLVSKTDSMISTTENLISMTNNMVLATDNMVSSTKDVASTTANMIENARHAELEIGQMVERVSRMREQLRDLCIKPDRYISKEVRREVWDRDMGRCTNCGSTNHLEFDHIVPVSKGGSSTTLNIELLCKNCNRVKSNKEPGYH